MGVGVIQYRNRDKLEGKKSALTLCGPCIGCCFGAAWNRSQLRTAAGMQEAYWLDCARYTICCLPCMSVQEYKEVELLLAMNEAPSA